MNKRSKYDTAQDIIHNRHRSNPRGAKLIARAFLQYFKSTEPNFDPLLFKEIMKKREDGNKGIGPKAKIESSGTQSRDDQINAWLDGK